MAATFISKICILCNHSFPISGFCRDRSSPRSTRSSCNQCAGTGKPRIRHRLAYLPSGKIRPAYNAWSNLLNRCYNPTNWKFPRYGGRGITVCERWRVSFENFYADMGDRPSPLHTLERENNNGNYEPDNCKWATRKEQARNRSTNRLLTAFGETLPLASWAERYRLGPGTLRMRILRGESVESALTRDIYKSKLTETQMADVQRRLASGESISALARVFGVARPTITRARDKITA